MTKISSLNDLLVYQESLNLAKEIFFLCKNQKLNKEYSLCDQIKRSSISISANIAEGYGRKSKTDFAHFLSIAVGSSNETVTFLDFINLVFPTIITNQLKERYLILGKRIYSLRKSLTTNN